jgi:hypothetical protein
MTTMKGYTVEFKRGRAWCHAVFWAKDESEALDLCRRQYSWATAWRIPGEEPVFNERYRRKA